MIAEVDIWQVMCGKEIYQADIETLKQWIVEGVVLPTDQVRKGNLRWLDASRVPSLRPVFTGEEIPAPADPTPAAAPEQQQHAQPFAAMPDAAQPCVAPSQAAQPFAAGVYHASPMTDAGASLADATSQASFADDSAVAAQTSFGGWQPEHDPFFRAAEDDAGAGTDFVPHQKDFAARAADAPSLRALGTACYNHPHVAPKYICRVCQTPMCASCPKFVNGVSIALCPLCGDFCNLYAEVREKASRQVHKAGGFGFADFGQAIVYPFKNIVGLIGISILYSILALGGIKGQIVAFVVIFGCMSLVIKQMAWGRFDRGFLPDFSSMSLWDDVAVPCFLGLGISIVTIGPAVLIFLALLFGVVGSGPSLKEHSAADIEARQKQVQQHAERVMNPDTSQEDLQDSLAALNGGRVDGRKVEPTPQAMTDAERQFAEDMNAITKEDVDIDSERYVRVRRASIDGPEAVYGGSGNSDMGMMRRVGAGMAGSIALVLLLLVALLWAFFYYPMALLVAGFTEDVWSVINPLVGLDTIRRMGWNYAKAFLMYTSVQIVSLVVGVTSMVALSAFDMPFVGNLPARFIEGGFNFYASLVIAALLGLVLYKSSDRLGIETD